MIREKPLNDSNSGINSHLVELVTATLTAGHDDVSDQEKGLPRPCVEYVLEELNQVVGHPCHRHSPELRDEFSGLIQEAYLGRCGQPSLACLPGTNGASGEVQL